MKKYPFPTLFKTLVAFLLMVFTLPGCSLLFQTIHTRSNNLEPGLTRAQVIKIMGRPSYTGFEKASDGSSRYIETLTYREVSTDEILFLDLVFVNGRLHSKHPYIEQRKRPLRTREKVVVTGATQTSDKGTREEKSYEKRTREKGSREVRRTR